jgi:hypothetical protein
MMRNLIERIIGKKEQTFGVSLEYLREIAGESETAFLKFGLFAPLAGHRKHLPKDAWHLARLAATMAEDCVSSVQIVASQARSEGIPSALIKTALAGTLDELPMDLALVIRFADVVAKGGDNEYLRNRLIRIYGRPAVNELALAVATARVFPALKRGMGRAQSCQARSVEKAEKQTMGTVEFATL